MFIFFPNPLFLCITYAIKVLFEAIHTARQCHKELVRDIYLLYCSSWSLNLSLVPREPKSAADGGVYKHVKC